VFGCALLAVESHGKLICTELAHALTLGGRDAVTPDEYLAHIARRLYFPSPVFRDYQVHGKQVFPMCAVLKLLLARLRAGLDPKVSLSDVFELILGNGCTGTEEIDMYLGLRPSAYSSASDEGRQVREMLVFFSQFSFLKWDNPHIWLDVSNYSVESIAQLGCLATPVIRTRLSDRADEVLELGRFAGANRLPVIHPVLSSFAEDEFVEGRRVRVVHLVSERSGKLRQLFFAAKRQPWECDMCETNLCAMYPWTGNLLEVHHLLPLSAPVRAELRKTSVADLVGLCPTCHRATHSFYKQWLRGNGAEDFADKEHARSVYDQARRSVVQ
jgi:hypothetical protein